MNWLILSTLNSVLIDNDNQRTSVEKDGLLSILISKLEKSQAVNAW